MSADLAHQSAAFPSTLRADFANFCQATRVEMSEHFSTHLQFLFIPFPVEFNVHHKSVVVEKLISAACSAVVRRRCFSVSSFSLFRPSLLSVLHY